MPILDERNTSTSILNPITIPCIHCELDDASDKPHLMHFLFIVFFCVGCYYASYGYRYFRSSMFLYGFNFAVIFVYTLCSNGDIMPEVYNKFLAAFAGFVLGIIAVLVQSLGLFITGLHTGVLKGAFLLILFSHVYATDLPSTYWISIIVCFVFGMITASMNVIWKKGLTIVSTSVYGGALVAISLDHFLEDLAMVKWLYKRAMLEPVVEQPCTLSWMIFAVWPVTTLIGIFVQTFWTGTGIHHDQDCWFSKKTYDELRYFGWSRKTEAIESGSTYSPTKGRACSEKIQIPVPDENCAWGCDIPVIRASLTPEEEYSRALEHAWRHRMQYSAKRLHASHCASRGYCDSGFRYGRGPPNRSQSLNNLSDFDIR